MFNDVLVCASGTAIPSCDIKRKRNRFRSKNNRQRFSSLEMEVFIFGIPKISSFSAFSYLLRLVLNVEQRLRGAFEEQAQFIFAHWRWVGLVLPLRWRLLVEQFVEDSRASWQNRLMRMQKCHFRLSWRASTHLHRTNGLSSFADQKSDVTQLRHRGQELEVFSQPRLVLESRFRLVQRQRLGSERISAEIWHVDWKSFDYRFFNFAVNNTTCCWARLPAMTMSLSWLMVNGILTDDQSLKGARTRVRPKLT